MRASRTSWCWSPPATATSTTPAVRQGGPRAHRAAGPGAGHRLGVVVLGREPRSAQEQGRQPGAGVRIGQGRSRHEAQVRQAGHGEVHDARPTLITTAVTGRAEIAPSGQRGRPSTTSRARSCSPRPSSSSRSSSCSAASIAALLPLSVGMLAVVATLVDPHDPRVAHRGLGLRAEPDDRARPRARDRLQPVRRLPLPRGARRPARPRTSRSGARCRPRAGPVVFSAGTVMISLAALLLFPVTYLRSFAYAGVAVVFLAAVVVGDRPARDPRGARPAGGGAAGSSRSSRRPKTASGATRPPGS